MVKDLGREGVHGTLGPHLSFSSPAWCPLAVGPPGGQSHLGSGKQTRNPRMYLFKHSTLHRTQTQNKNPIHRWTVQLRAKIQNGGLWSTRWIAKFLPPPQWHRRAAPTAWWSCFSCRLPILGGNPDPDSLRQSDHHLLIGRCSAFFSLSDIYIHRDGG